MRNFMKVLLLALVALCMAETGVYAQEADESREYKTLDKSNLVIKEWLTDVASGAKVLDHSTTFNSEGRKIEEEEYNDKGLQWRKVYEYGANGKVSRELIYDFRGHLDNVKKYQYNEFNRRATESTYNARGKLVKIKVYEYIVAR